MYGWPPVRPVWNQMYDYWNFLFLFAKQTNPNQSNGRSMVQWYFPLKYSLLTLSVHSLVLRILKILATKTTKKWRSSEDFLFAARSKKRWWNIKKNWRQDVSSTCHFVKQHVYYEGGKSYSDWDEKWSVKTPSP